MALKATSTTATPSGWQNFIKGFLSSEIAKKQEAKKLKEEQEKTMYGSMAQGKQLRPSNPGETPDFTYAGRGWKYVPTPTDYTHAMDLFKIGGGVTRDEATKRAADLLAMDSKFIRASMAEKQQMINDMATSIQFNSAVNAQPTIPVKKRDGSYGMVNEYDIMVDRQKNNEYTVVSMDELNRAKNPPPVQTKETTSKQTYLPSPFMQDIKKSAAALTTVPASPIPIKMPWAYMNPMNTPYVPTQNITPAFAQALSNISQYFKPVPTGQYGVPRR